MLAYHLVKKQIIKTILAIFLIYQQTFLQKIILFYGICENMTLSCCP